MLGRGTRGDGCGFDRRGRGGWVGSFTEDVGEAIGDRRGEALSRLKALAADPVIALADGKRLSALAAELHEERFLARPGFRIAMRGLLALIAVEVGRIAGNRARATPVEIAPTDATVATLRKLVEGHFQRER